MEKDQLVHLCPQGLKHLVRVEACEIRKQYILETDALALTIIMPSSGRSVQEQSQSFLLEADSHNFQDVTIQSRLGPPTRASPLSLLLFLLLNRCIPLGLDDFPGLGMLCILSLQHIHTRVHARDHRKSIDPLFWCKQPL